MKLDAHLHPSSISSGPGKRSCPGLHKNAERIGLYKKKGCIESAKRTATSMACWPGRRKLPLPLAVDIKCITNPLRERTGMVHSASRSWPSINPPFHLGSETRQYSLLGCNWSALSLKSYVLPKLHFAVLWRLSPKF